MRFFRLALLESLLLLNRSDDEDPSQANRSIHRRRQQATALDDESAKGEGCTFFAHVPPYPCAG